MVKTPPSNAGAQVGTLFRELKSRTPRVWPKMKKKKKKSPSAEGEGQEPTSLAPDQPTSASSGELMGAVLSWVAPLHAL